MIQTDSIETRVALLEQSIGTINQTLIRIENRLDNFEHRVYERFDKMDSKIDKLNSDAKSDFRWLLAIISGLGLIMAHGFKWF